MHVPVLAREVFDVLRPRAGEAYVDLTAGLGGHAESAAGMVGPEDGGGLVVLVDVDPANIERASRRVAGMPAPPKVVAIRANFAEVGERWSEFPCLAGRQADVVLADLGFASNQMGDPARGFSFQRDGPLDMRLDPSLRASAAEVVNTWSEQELARAIADFGEEREARRVARKLVEARAREPITTTARLADLVRSVVRRSGDIDPATRTFQALRIAVNDELGCLDALLASIARPGEGWLAPGARVGIISFHSLEDRLVKRAFRAMVESDRAAPLTGAPVVPGNNELETNPRARSAKFRAIRLGSAAAGGRGVE